MKTLIIYKSVHQGNTRRIAKEMADALSADLREPHEVDADTMDKYDLVGFGSGIYWMRHHTEILQLVSRLQSMKGKPAFIFSTHGSGSTTLYHRELRKKLEAKGFKIIGEYSCKAHDAVGPLKLLGGINRGRPNEADLEKARLFAKGLRI